MYKKISGDSSSIQSISDELVKKVNYTSEHLLSNSSKSVVVCGLDDLSAQIITNRINDILNSNVKSDTKVSLVRNGSDSKVNSLLNRIKKEILKD